MMDDKSIPKVPDDSQPIETGAIGDEPQEEEEKGDGRCPLGILDTKGLPCDEKPAFCTACQMSQVSDRLDELLDALADMLENGLTFNHKYTVDQARPAKHMPRKPM